MSRLNPVDHPVHDVIARRWSPVGFADRPVAAADLRSLFEAARWAPSAFNEQPWSFIVARREDADHFAAVHSCLVEGNQDWAANAPVLMLTVASEQFARNGAPNATALYDLGQAVAMLTVEATARGLAVHQMGGILPDRAAELFGVPDGRRVATALAVGYAVDDVTTLPEAWQARDTAPRVRRPLADTVFSTAWRTAADLSGDR
jgi:nitroreductase